MVIDNPDLRIPPRPRRNRPDASGYAPRTPADFAAPPPRWIPRDCNVAPRERGRLAVALFWLGYPIALIWGIALVLWAFPGLCT